MHTGVHETRFAKFKAPSATHDGGWERRAGFNIRLRCVKSTILHSALRLPKGQQKTAAVENCGTQRVARFVRKITGKIRQTEGSCSSLHWRFSSAAPSLQFKRKNRRLSDRESLLNRKSNPKSTITITE